MKTAIIGLGLIGGSFALSLKDKGLSDQIWGVEQSERNAQKALELGLSWPSRYLIVSAPTRY